MIVESTTKPFKRKEDEIDILDFKAKSEEEVIKVARCTYANDYKGTSTFYFCQCSVEEFYPICEACAEQCHKEHKPTLKLEGTYTCMCGKGNHLISRENERRFNEKKFKTLNQCFFSKFMEITPNRGYYNYNNQTICSVCVQYCHNKNFDHKDLSKANEMNPTCNCEKHYEVNVINLNLELLSKPKFHSNLQNFNFNIISKIPTTKQMYLDYLLAKITEYQFAPNHKNSKSFFTNFINFKILELFSAFASKWENKFFHIKNYFERVPVETLFKLMSLEEPISILTESDAPDFATSKFYFAEMIFNYITRTYQLKHNNLLNVRTIINMNLFQRFVYLKEIKNFYKFDYESNELINSEAKFDEMSLAFVDLYDNILKINENFDFKEQILSYIFPTFNRIFKYLIKYNLINDEVKSKYFVLVSDTLALGNDSEQCDLKGSELYIVKAIFYCLLYRNDALCVTMIRGLKDLNNKKFVFIDDIEVETMCKVFMMVVDRYNRQEDLGRTVIYDFYVRKIMEILIGKNQFVIKSLENLLHPSIPDHHIQLLESNELHMEMRRYLNLNLINDLVRFTKKLNTINRAYLDYNITHDAYQTKANDIFQELIQFLNKYVNFIPDLNKKYQIFQEKFTTDEATNEKIYSLQQCAKYTLIFQKLEEFFFIYSEGKRFNSNEKFENKLQPQYLRLILNFLFLLVNKNYENLTLAMNFKTICFVNSLYDEKEALFDYLELISEMIFCDNRNYQFDNVYFYTETLNDMLDHVTFDNQSNQSNDKVYKNLEKFGRIMRLTIRAISKTSMETPDPLNCIERIMDKIRLIKSNTKLKNILHEYFNQDNKQGDLVSVSPVEKFLQNYFDFCNELIFNDFYFFGLIKDSDFIFDVETVADLVFGVGRDELHPELEAPMTRFYFLNKISFGITIGKINTQMENLFMKNVPGMKNASLPHLAMLSLDKIFKEIATLNLHLIKFEKKYKNISNYFAKIENHFERKLNLLKYFEHCVVRPTFTIINHFILNLSIVKGSDCYAIYELVFNFHKAVSYFYSNIIKSNDIPSFLNENNRADSKIFEKKLITNSEILDFEGVVVMTEIDLNLVDEINEDTKKFQKNEIKYFEIEKLYKMFMKNIVRIIRVIPNQSDDYDTDDLSLTKFSSYVAKFSNQKTAVIKNAKKPYYKERLEKLIKKYKEKLISVYDNGLALIKTLEVSDGDCEVDLGLQLYSYLLSKFADELEDNNFASPYMQENYAKGKIGNISVETFKFQNLYTLFYLNSLFYHDSPRFQSILEENIGEDYEIFFNFLTKNLIYPSVLAEVVKVYEIDKIQTMNRPFLANEISTIAIKFLQNMCESHNQVFQNRFFTHKFNIDVKDYLDIVKDGAFEEDTEHKLTTRESYMRQTFYKTKQLASDSYIDDFNSNKRSSTAQTTKKILLKPQLSNENINSHVEHLDRRKKREQEELSWLSTERVSFFNFISNNMRLIIENLSLGKDLKNSLLVLNREIKVFTSLSQIYQRFSDLIVEMLQGTHYKNYDYFYKRLSDSLHVFDDNCQLSNPSSLESFGFIGKCIEIKSLLLESNDVFDTVSIQMKTNLFFTINNLINQEMVDVSLLKIFIVIFPPDKIVDLISAYLRGLCVRHLQKIKYDDEKFQETYEELELNRVVYTSLIKRFKDNTNIYDDEFFKLASQMYLFLTILGEKYHIPEAERILRLNRKEIVLNPDDTEEPNEKKKNIFVKTFLIVKHLVLKNQIDDNLIKKKKRIKYHINNLIITSTFFNKIIHSCEFMIDSSNDEADELALKKIYFIIDPRVYLISKNNIENFLEEVDRSSSTTKLKSLIDVLNHFSTEVEYKHSNLKKSNYLKWMMEVDYKEVDFMNFIISLIINMTLLIFLKGDSIEKGFVYYTTIILALVQITINLIFLSIFCISKYKFHVIVGKKNLGKKSLSTMEWLNLHILDSFLFNDEIYLLILNIIIGCLGIVSSYSTFLFSLQLLTVIKFVPTIKEIVIAFKLRFSQLISMIGFLAILIFFYSNIGFYFFSDEFVKELDNGQTENLCQTLLECSITYFNLGVRSGGGIGDLLDMKPYRDKSIYWIRWVTDMIFYITVILLLLNMINGVIVSTFSQIREESNKKEEDINNKCFICSIDRVEFEKRKIAFADHQKLEHNIKTYIRLLIYLKLTSVKDLDADQSFIINCIKERDISCFPVLRSFSVGNLQQNDDEKESEDE